MSPAQESRASGPDFDAMYRGDRDPWQVESSWYERRKLAVLLATLPRERYRRAWEPGSGPGASTLRLAGRADDLVASDGSQAAIDLARARPDMPAHVELVHSRLPEVPFTGTVDLVVAAELLYYLPDLGAALEAVWSVCDPGAHVVFLHWAHQPHDGFASGPQLHGAVGLDALQRGARHLVGHVDEEFLLDVYERTP